MAELLAWCDGRVVPAAEATIPLADDGLLRGDGCFEVVRVNEGQPFCLDEHLARMERSARALRLPTTGVREAFAALCPGFEGYVRALVTRGPPPRVFALQESPEELPGTMRLLSVPAPWMVPLGSAPLAGAKTLSYAHNMSARRLALEGGFDDALLLTPDSVVLEGPTWSLMWVERGRIFTPPLRLGILDSITRRILMELAEVTEEEARIERVQEADEVLVCSTARDGVGVVQLDDARWDGPGPVTKDLGRRLRARMHTG